MGTKKTSAKLHSRKLTKIPKSETDRQEPRVGMSYHDIAHDPPAQTWTVSQHNIDQRHGAIVYPFWLPEQPMWSGRTPEVGSVGEIKFSLRTQLEAPLRQDVIVSMYELSCQFVIHLSSRLPLAQTPKYPNGGVPSSSMRQP